MIRRLFVAMLALALPASFAIAQTKVTKAPIKPTTIDGKTMYHSYCAVCHGKEAKGDGPAVSALTKPPADLTKISARNGGTFPDVKVRRYIEGLDEVPSHGSRDMPMWGDVFRSLDRDMAQIRISALTEYLKTLQTK